MAAAGGPGAMTSPVESEPQSHRHVSPQPLIHPVADSPDLGCHRSVVGWRRSELHRPHTQAEGEWNGFALSFEPRLGVDRVSSEYFESYLLNLALSFHI